MKGCILSGDDFQLDEEPRVNSMVLYYLHNQDTGKRQAHAGIIAREQDKHTWVIGGTPVYKIQTLFVITTDAYIRFKALTNPLAV